MTAFKPSHNRLNVSPAWLGPLLVATGASLWGLETLWRVRLGQVFSADVMVLYEHVIFVLLSLPLLVYAWPWIRRMSGRSWGFLIASGILGSAVGATCFTLALKGMNASAANVFLQIQPVMSVLYARWLLGEQLAHGFWRWASLALSAGALLAIDGLSDWHTGIHWEALNRISQGLNPALGFVLLTALCWSFSTVAGRAVNLEVPWWVASPLRFVIGLLSMVTVVAINGHWGDWRLTAMQQPGTWRDLLALSVLAGFIPLFLYFKGLSLTPASVASFWEMFQIVAALLVTGCLLGQPLSPHQVLATVLLIIAVQRINQVQAQKTPPIPDNEIFHA